MPAALGEYNNGGGKAKNEHGRLLVWKWPPLTSRIDRQSWARVSKKMAFRTL
jgi:hypothetical protein